MTVEITGYSIQDGIVMLAQNFINMINSFWEKNIDSQKEKIKKYAESLSSANKSLE